MMQLTTAAPEDALGTSGLTKLPGLRSHRPTPSLDPGEVFYHRDRQAIPDRSVAIWSDPLRRPLFESVQRKINELLRLPRRWDGRSGEPITSAAVATGVQLIGTLTTPTSVPPQLFPLPDGGMTIGWRVAGDEIEIEIDAGGGAIVLAVTADERTVAEGSIDPVEPNDTTLETRRFLARMSARPAS
jgi:hypothetical protein